MSFLLGAFGKLAAGRTYRNLQARLMRVRTRLNRATRQTATMSKMIETQKKMELNNLTAQASFANSSIGATLVRNELFSAQEVAMFGSGAAAWNSGDMDVNTRNRYTAFTQAQSEMKARNEMVLAQMKNAIEESDLKGYEFQNVEISVGEDFEEMYPDIILPCFYRLIPLGNVCVQDEKCSNPEGMDFCITEKSYLVLSERAMNVVKDFQIENAEVTEIYVE